jgi:hypothetical protein
MDVEKRFCPSCGSNTLIRTSYSIEDGVMKLHLKRVRDPDRFVHQTFQVYEIIGLIYWAVDAFFPNFSLPCCLP